MGWFDRLLNAPLALPKTAALSAPGPAPHPTLAGPVVAYSGWSLSDPALLEMMRGAGGRTGVAGVAVNERLALRNSTFFRAMSLQCGSMGMLPLHLRKRDGRTTEKATDHPLFNVLLRKPNDFQTASRFKSYMQLCALLDGNAYALKVKSRGAVRQLIPLPRRRVKPDRTAGASCSRPTTFSISGPRSRSTA
jgi:hypothetical protein